jgi:hypothetical protein
MTTLDSMIQEVIKRTQAAGGHAWIAEDAPTEMKLAFIRALSSQRPKTD